MNAQTPVFDLDPVLHVMGMGLIVAALPLAWLWLRNRQATPAVRLRALTLLTLFLTFDLVLFGAFTRLTDSGLGCPDWPGCYGYASPVGAQDHIANAQAAMPTGPVTHGKAWVEMVHRYLATGVGALILMLAVATWVIWWRGRRQVVDASARPISPWWATGTLLWVCAQGAFGAFTVTMKLFPAIVTLHLLGGVGLLVLLVIQEERYRQAHGGAAEPVAPDVRRWLWVAAAVVGLQITLGGWVSTNYAALACPDFPTCQGSWWPTLDFNEAFVLWRGIGVDYEGGVLDGPARAAIHIVHRIGALLVSAYLLWLGWRLWRSGGRGWASMLVGLLLLQISLGIGNVIFGLPLPLATAHVNSTPASMSVTVRSFRTPPALTATGDR